MSTDFVPPVAGAIPFVDVSSNNEDDQHQIDWPTLAQSLLSIHPEAGAIIKVSQGDWYVNPYLHRQRWGAHAAGLRNVGLYHYLELISQGGANAGKPLSGAANADWLLKCLGDDAGIVKGEFLVGDWEDQPANVSGTADLDAMCLDFGGRLQRPLGIPPGIYSADWYARPHNLERDPSLLQFWLWWASYQNVIPPVPEPWSTAGRGISLWQFTANARLPGLPWQVDVSWWLAGIDALRAIQWGYQSDPVAGKPVDGIADVDGDVQQIVRHCLDLLTNNPSPDLGVVRADLALALTKSGLLP